MEQSQILLQKAPIRRQKESSKAFNHPLLSNTPKFHLKGHRAPVTCLALHPLFSSLASASEDCSIRIWDYETGEYERSLKGHTKAVHHITFDAQGILLASASADTTIRVWDVTNDYAPIKTLHGHEDTVSCVSFTPSGEHLVSASKDKTVKVWEVATGFCVQTLVGHEEWVKKVDAHSNHGRILSCSVDQTCILWDLQSADCLMEFRGHEHVVDSVKFVPHCFHASIEAYLGRENSSTVEDQYFVSTSRDKTIKVWDITTGDCVMTMVSLLYSALLR